MTNRRVSRAYSVAKIEKAARQWGQPACTSDRREYTRTDRRETRRHLRTYNFLNLED